jgi:hypothetical protein
MIDWQLTNQTLALSDEDLLNAALRTIRSSDIKVGVVKHLLKSLQTQREYNQHQEAHSWEPQNLGLTILQTYVNAPELRSSIWSINNSVGAHYLESRISLMMPPRHTGWQFCMTRVGDITNPHIDPPLSWNIFWQVVGHKLWGLWPATSTNLAVFEKTEVSQQTWKWAIETLDEDGWNFLIMEPGTWWEVKPFMIHACVTLIYWRQKIYTLIKYLAFSTNNWPEMYRAGTRCKPFCLSKDSLIDSLQSPLECQNQCLLCPRPKG